MNMNAVQMTSLCEYYKSSVVSRFRKYSKRWGEDNIEIQTNRLWKSWITEIYNVSSFAIQAIYNMLGLMFWKGKLIKILFHFNLKS